jgi:hypothetical protein
LGNPQLHGGVEDVVGAHRVDLKGGIVGPDQDAGDRGKVDDGVIARHTGPRLQLVKARIGRARIEHLARVGQLDVEPVDAGHIEADLVDVGHPVTALDQIGDGMSPRLAAAAREQNAHVVSPCRQTSLFPGPRPVARAKGSAGAHENISDIPPLLAYQSGRKLACCRMMSPIFAQRTPPCALPDQSSPCPGRFLVLLCWQPRRSAR